MRSRKYQSPSQIKADFGATVDFLSDNRIVFDIGGNRFRLVAKILYKRGWVLIRHVLTHKEYDWKSSEGTL